MNYSTNKPRYLSPEPEPEPEPEPVIEDVSPWITADNVNNVNNVNNHNEISINQYMKYRRNIQISGSIFSGYMHEIDIRYVDSIKDIILSTKENLKAVFKGNGMHDLVDEVDKTNFHIHSHTFDDILLKMHEIIYICNC
tara:strand:+ start:217 stop:633 length:417 start_codon:yes stop_codon:yes gene_type:complete